MLFLEGTKRLVSTHQMSSNLLCPPVQDTPLRDVSEVHLLQQRHTSRRRLVTADDSKFTQILQVLNATRVHGTFEVLNRLQSFLKLD